MTRTQQQLALGQALDITVGHHRALADPWDRVIQEWTVTAVAADLDSIEPNPSPHPVCRLELAKVILSHPDQDEVVSCHSRPLNWVRDALLDDAGELREDRLDPDALIGGNAILAITEAFVESAYSGLGVGSLVTLETITTLGGGCDLAVVVTIDPPDMPRDVKSLDKNRALRAWHEIGFERVTDQVMVAYLAMATVDEHLQRMRSTFGLLS